MRQDLAEHILSNVEFDLATYFGASRSTINDIVKRRTWMHLEVQ